MAETKKNSSPVKKGKTRKSPERRRHILLIMVMVAGLLALLSLVGYSDADEAALEQLSLVDVIRIPFVESVRVQTEGLHNRLGLLGAFIANFFINDTVGYASLVFPVLLMVWGWTLFRRNEYSRLITLTNYSVIAALLFSTTFGVVNLLTNVSKEWSGLMGAFAADILTHLLGTVGALIIVATALLITIMLAIDLDIHTSIDRVKAIAESVVAWIARKKNERAQRSGEEPEHEVVIKKPDVELLPKAIPGISARIETKMSDVEDRDAMSQPLRIEVQEQANDPSPGTVQSPPPVVNQQEEIDYVFPSVELLDVSRQADTIPDDELKANAELVRAKLANFGVEIESVSVTPGPVITLYELVPASGVKISRIVSLENDLALALAAKGIRIMAPIPGKSAVGVEIPNRNPSMVYLRSVINSSKFRETNANLPIALGKSISGDVLTDDLSKMPHLLIAGSTGSGKSVGINTILASLLFRLHPSDVKFVIIDPKKIELTQYAKLKHHFLAVSPDIDEEIITTPENAVCVLKSVELEMEKRYDRLAAAGVRNIQDYNERLKTGRLKNTETILHSKMPYLVVIIDELADLMMTAAREVEEPIARLAQLARAVGVHLVLATQRPSVDVITGVIKANFPARIAYQVASKTDSRTILDMNGAEQLLGSGDMLYLPSGSPKPSRVQNAYISSDEVERLTDHIAQQQGYAKPFQLPSILERKKGGARGMSDSRDEFFEEAARLIVRHQQGSVSLLQRRLKVGYSRAARLVDELEAAGIVGPFDGSKARLVLVDSDDQLDRILQSIEG